MLEIGTGWGGFALHAAKRYGCRVTTTTISPKQYDYSRRQVAAAGLGERITVLGEDYRALAGTFDKLVSIEMIEAVGHQFFVTFFHACSQRLKPEGMMLLQAIVIPDQRYDRYPRSVDFIQKYVFPGGCLPSVGAICHSLGRATEFNSPTWKTSRRITPRRCRCGGSDSSPHRSGRGQGFSEEFIRTWEYYFCYCEARSASGPSATCR